MRSCTFFLLLLFPFFSFSQGIEFFEGSWEEAIELAKAQEKLIFVDAYAQWCGPCKKMAKYSFTDKDLGDFHAKNFISLKMDMEDEMSINFRKKFPVSAYPTIFYINSKVEVVKKFTGGKSAEQLISMGKEAIGSNDLTPDLKIAYDEGNRDYDFVLKYVKELNKVGKPSLKISNDYLNSKPKISENQKLEFLMVAVTESDSKLFEQMIASKDKLKKLKGESILLDKVTNACNATVIKAVEFEYPELVEQAVASMKSAFPKEEKEYAFVANNQYALGMLNYEDWVSNNEKYIKKYKKNDSDFLKSLIKDTKANFGKKPEAKVLIGEYYDKLIKMDDSSENYFNYIRLLIENRNLSKASQMIDEAKEKAQSRGEDIQKLDGLVKYIKSL